MAENVKRKKKKRAVLIVLMALVLAVLAVVCVYETELNKLDSNDGVDNSFYDSQFKNKKVMVIVPHEDDDLLISGQVLPPMYKNGADVRVVFATNGDKRVSAYTRQSEACNALEKLGIPREKVIFLGYPDGTQLYVGKKLILSLPDGIILMRERDLKIITSTVSELTPNIQPKIWSMISKVLFSNIARIIF